MEREKRGLCGDIIFMEEEVKYTESILVLSCLC